MPKLPSHVSTTTDAYIKRANTLYLLHYGLAIIQDHITLHGIHLTHDDYYMVGFGVWVQLRSTVLKRKERSEVLIIGV